MVVMGVSVAALLSENLQLREALKEQWECNHTEHCDIDWPHPEGEACMWPLPVILGGRPH